jgi:hypothetical protein
MIIAPIPVPINILLVQAKTKKRITNPLNVSNNYLTLPSNFLEMSTPVNKNSFEWVWYVLGALAFVLAFSAVTTNIGYLLLGAIIGLIFAGVFLNKIVKGREY